MCEPTTLMAAGLAMSAASTGVGYMQQSRAAKAQSKYQQDRYNQDAAFHREQEEYQLERYMENADRANEEVRRNYSEIDKRIGQDAVTASLEINDLFRQSRAMQTNEIAMQAEKEVTGATADYLLDNIARHEMEAAENIRLEQKWRLNSMMDAKSEIEAQGQARIESMNPQPIPLPALPQPVAEPSPFAALLNLGSQALSVMNNYEWQTNPGTRTAGGAPVGGALGTNIRTPTGHSIGSINRFGQLDFTRSYYR